MSDEHDAFVVVINAEEQYALWPATRAIPAGWNDTGAKGTRDECVEFVNGAWKDMRPASLRKALSKQVDDG
jgi:MbtH protein